MGVLHFQDLELEEFWEQDEDIAEEMERLLAQREHLQGNEDATVDSETRGEQLAATIVAGEEEDG